MNNRWEEWDSYEMREDNASNSKDKQAEIDAAYLEYEEQSNGDSDRSSYDIWEDNSSDSKDIQAEIDAAYALYETESPINSNWNSCDIWENNDADSNDIQAEIDAAFLLREADSVGVITTSDLGDDTQRELEMFRDSIPTWASIQNEIRPLYARAQELLAALLAFKKPDYQSRRESRDSRDAQIALQNSSHGLFRADLTGSGNYFTQEIEFMHVAIQLADVLDVISELILEIDDYKSSYKIGSFANILRSDPGEISEKDLLEIRQFI